MMAALLTGPVAITVSEVPTPQAGEDELLLRVDACGICGTDVRTYRNGDPRAPYPWLLGHEVVGTVVQVGRGAASRVAVKEGDRVFVASILSCGTCRWCRAGRHNLCTLHHLLGFAPYPGAYAEYMVVPEIALKNVFPLPPGSAPEACTQADPFSNVINGQEILEVNLGDAVVVIGAGPIGCMHAHVARLRGAARVLMFDVAAERLALSRQAVPDPGVTFHHASGDAAVETVLDATGGEGAQRVVVACSSHEAQQDALRMAGKQARVLYFGGLPKHRPTIEFDSNILHYGEVTVCGSYGATLPQMQTALEMISSGRVAMDRIVTHRLPLSHAGEAFRLLDQGQALKAVVVPDQGFQVT